MPARRFIVSGRVQGVGYRYFTLTAALSYGICGWARNTPDGRVEVWAEADKAGLESFKADLERGSFGSRVRDVVEEELPTSDSFSSFTIRG